MSPDTLPLALLIVTVEMTVGGVWILLFAQARNNAAASFVKFDAAMVFLLAAGGFFIAAAINVGDEVDGYPLDNSWMDEARVALAVVFAASALYAYATLRGHRTPALVLGGVTSVAGLAAVALLAQVVGGPTWGYPLVLATLAVGAIVVGAVENGMVLGHWYLVTPRLPEAPLREMTGLLVLFTIAQVLLIGLALVLPHDSVNTSVDTEIISNPFFWLRMGLGLAFPGLLAWMAYDSTSVRAMQSATGLLYIAMVLVFCGQVVGVALLLGSGVPN